jgi:hypothetical protein
VETEVELESVSESWGESDEEEEEEERRQLIEERLVSSPFHVQNGGDNERRGIQREANWQKQKKKPANQLKIRTLSH